MTDFHYPPSRLFETQFQPQNDKENQAFLRLTNFLEAHGEAAIGHEITGHLGHITACARIENYAGTKLLLVFSSKEGRWKYPGAHIEKEPRATAIQEATRALGRDTGAPEERIYSLCEREIAEYWNTPAHIHFEITYRFVADETGNLPRGARWFENDEAKTLIEGKQ